MKNLQAIIRRNIDFQSDVVGYCIDSDNGTLFTLTKKFKLFKTQIHSENVAIEEQNLEDSISSYINGITSIDQDDVRLFEFVVEMGGLLLALKTGQLLIISSSSADCHCLYKHDRSISSISLSPSQDLIALADDENNIQVMYCSDCDIINKSNALTQNESLYKPVGVGWGSKETQFFGLDGRPSQEKQEATAAAKVELDNSDEIAISDQIEDSVEFKGYQCKRERSTVIDWRGDGQLIGTLTYIPESNKHYLKVWNRNLELQYMSEQLVTVERGLLCWIPDGQYLCCAQRRDRRLNEVALFEKNGLVRQRISLPTIMKDMYIVNMAWCSDSKIFAIIVKQFHVSSDGRIRADNILMLYTMQNWHYYLKSAIKLKSNCDYSLLKWDVTNINRLHIMSTNGLYSEFDCCFQVTSSDQNSTVLVVDANKVLLTPLEICIVPPPMSAITLELPSPIYRLAIDFAVASDIFMLTLDGELFYTFERWSSSLEPMCSEGLKVSLNNSVAEKLYQNLSNYNRIMILDAQSYQHLIPVGGLDLVASKLTPTGSEIVRIKLPRSQHEQIVFETLKTFDRNQVINLSRCAPNRPKNLSIILNDSSCFILNLSTGEVVPLSDFHLIIAESRYSYNIIDSQTVDRFRCVNNEKTAVISLGQDYCLRLNKIVLASNSCTSFRLTENYLIYTTLENSIHFILFKNILADKTADNNCVDSWQQQIETGGTIVTASENNFKVVLQMPRGNLETIHPRILLFSSLTILLEDQKKYVEACKLARRHRVNMNFLVDYLMRLDKDYVFYWTAFALKIANHDPNLLCLILTELDNGDTISGRYQGIIKHLPVRQTDFLKKIEISDKVNRFCSAINLPGEQKFLYPRIQKFLRMEPKRIEEALNIVYSLDQNSRLDAIKYILYFIDIDQLFSDALGTYNTDIALMVASASNKDPKQYLALLDSFKGIENEVQYRYMIDMHIKRYDRAFDNLSSYLLSIQDDNQHKDIEITEEKLLELVVSKRIYRHAICHMESLEERSKFLCDEQLYLQDTLAATDGLSAKYNLEKLICRLWAKYAEYLLEKRHYDEAGLAYSKALGTSDSVEHFNSALKCYSLIEDWEKSMALIKRCKVNLTLKIDASRKLIKQLMERSKYQEATIIELLISTNFKSDIDLDWNLDIPNHCDWYLAETIAESSKFKRLCGVRNLHRCANVQMSRWSSDLAMARLLFERLKDLMATQQAKRHSDIMPERGFMSDSLSTVDGSEVSSISGLEECQQGKVARSGATSIKTRSSNSKSTKLSQKRINLKVGSRHEDIALVLEMKKFISKQSSNHEECSRYLATLFQYHTSTKEAYKYLTRFQDIMTESLEFAQEVSDLLWPTGPHLEQRYSLYKRLNQTLISADNPENVDFEILIRPELPKALNIFDM